MAQYTVKIQGLDRLRASLASSPRMIQLKLSAAIKTAIHIIRPIMKEEAPFDKGELRKNIYARYSGLVGEVGPDLSVTPYALYVHDGTRSYIIKPRTKPFLAWQDKSGKWRYAKQVRHPGIKPNPFVERTVTISKEPLERMFEATITDIVNTLAK